MNTSQPPRLALRLLERFGVDPALTGDLVEQYGQKGSGGWFWRQTTVAIARHLAAEVRSDRSLMVRALVVGWVTAMVIGRLTTLMLPLLEGRWAWQTESWLSGSLGFAVVPMPIVLSRVIGAVMIGWVIALFDRRQAMVMLAIYLVSHLLLDIGGFLNSLAGASRSPRDFYALMVNSVVPFAVIPPCTVLGGLIATWSGSIRARTALR